MKEPDYNSNAEKRIDRLRDACRLLLDNIPRIPDGPRWESLRAAKAYAQAALDKEKKLYGV